MFLWRQAMRRYSILSVFLLLSTAAAWAQVQEFRVNTYTAGDQSDASVAMDSSGNSVVVWQSQAQDGSYSGIFGQRYSGEGTPVGSEFPVNSYTTGFQGSPSAAMD